MLGIVVRVMSISFSNYYDFVASLKDRGWCFLGEGSFRLVYVKDNWVIKVPRDEDGALDNLMEAKAWRKYKSKRTSLGLYLAPCRLLLNGCLLMVAVETEHNKKLPWKPTKNDYPILDKDQAGVYKNRVVAYDFALDLKERFKWEQQLGVENSFFQTEWTDRRPHLFSKEKL